MQKVSKFLSIFFYYENQFIGFFIHQYNKIYPRRRDDFEFFQKFPIQVFGNTKKGNSTQKKKYMKFERIDNYG